MWPASGHLKINTSLCTLRHARGAWQVPLLATSDDGSRREALPRDTSMTANCGTVHFAAPEVRHHTRDAPLSSLYLPSISSRPRLACDSAKDSAFHSACDSACDSAPLARGPTPASPSHQHRIFSLAVGGCSNGRGESYVTRATWTLCYGRCFSSQARGATARRAVARSGSVRAT